MRKWLAVGAVLTGAVWVTIACQNGTPEAPSAVAGPSGNGAVTAMATPTPAPSPVFPSNMPVPTNPGPGQLPTQPVPVPIDGNPQPQPTATPGQPGGPGPTPSPSGSPTPGPSPSPPSGLFTVSNLFVATGSGYQAVGFDDGVCCDADNGAAWTDFGYHYNINITVSDRVYMIRTAQADVRATANPLMSFTIDKCALVTVYFPEAGPAPCYPAWIDAGGWQCSRLVNADGTCGGGTGGTVVFRNLANPNLTLNSIYCHKIFDANDTIQLGPRLPSGIPEYMYSVTVRPQGCPVPLLPTRE